MQCETALNRVTSDTVSITEKAAGIGRKAATGFSSEDYESFRSLP